MFSLDASNANEYLVARGLHWARHAFVESLGGGVSNTVLLVQDAGHRIVCKQALAKLRVQEDWLSRIDRTLREAEALQSVAPLLPSGAVPAVLFLDRENFIYAMEAAPAEARDWKTLLLAGQADPEIASTAGRILGSLIRGTWRSSLWRERFGDQTVFDELRLDPYYRFTATRRPALAPHFDRLIAMCRTRDASLVHGDWSPKNLLVHSHHVTAIDFEVVHYGDPCFDSGFLLNHLVLKAIHQPSRLSDYRECALAFWRALTAEVPPEADWMTEGTIAHLGGLLLARVDGKSPAEYLAQDEKDRARRLAYRFIETPPATLEELWSCL